MFTREHNAAIIVTVYKNRYTRLIKYLSADTNLSNMADIIVFRQDNDPATEEDYYLIEPYYKRYTVVNCNATDIRTKRRCYYDWAIKQGYDKILVLDDDVEPTCKHIDGITKVKSGKNKVNQYWPTEDMLQKIIEVSYKLDEEDKDWALLGCSHTGFLGIKKLDEEDIKRGYKLCKNSEMYIALVMINIKRTRQILDLQYQEGNIFEDKYFQLDCLLHGLNMYTFQNYAIYTKNNFFKNKDDSTVWIGENAKLNIEYCMLKQFKKYGGNIRLQPNGHLNVLFRKPPYLRQLGNTPIINTKKPTQVKIMNLLNQHEDLDNKELLGQVINILKEEKQ
jgi:hypothetical protein